MTATYDPTLIAADGASYISAVRWLIQDTDTSAAEVSDEEIAALYAATSSDDTQKVRTYDTAFACAQALERKYRKESSYTSGRTSVALGARADSWAKVVDELARDRFAARQEAANRSGSVISASRPAAYEDPFDLRYGGLLPRR